MVANKTVMELSIAFPSTLTATFYLLALIFLFKTLKRKKAKTGQNKNPPQPKGAWPIIGHLHLLSESDLSHRVLGKMVDTCGPIFTIKLGFHQALVVSDAEIAKECFTTKDKVFATRPKSLAVELLAYNYATFGLGPYGDYWRKVRKLVMVELLTQPRVDSLSYIRVQEVRASIKNIFEAWLNNKKRTNSDMVHVEMKQLFGNLILNIVTRTISGKRFLPDDEETARVLAVIRKFLELLGTFVVSDFIPCVKFLDLGGYQKGMKISAKEMDNILEGWLKDHKKRRECGSHHEGEVDFMDVLVSVLERESLETFPGFDHDTIIKSTTLAMLTAGVDTTAVTLIWALSLLLNNPDALKAAQRELDVHVGRERLVQQSDINNLVYLQAIIKETLRLYPAAPISVPRESMENCIVAGYKIPKGTRLIINLWKLHRDPNFWSDPNEFRPERFLTTQKDMDIKGKHYELLPFGSGRRMCPGVSFALQSMHLTLANLIQAFVLVKPSKEPIDMSESLGLTNMKASPLEVLLRPRLSFNMYHSDT